MFHNVKPRKCGQRYCGRISHFSYFFEFLLKPLRPPKAVKVPQKMSTSFSVSVQFIPHNIPITCVSQPLAFTYSKSTMETPEQCVKQFKVNIKYIRSTPWRRSGIFIVNFGHISHLVLVFLLLTLNMQMLISSATCTA